MMFWLLIGCILFTADRITKYLALVYFAQKDYVFNVFLEGTYLLNQGVTYSFLTPKNAMYFWALTFLICIVNACLLLYWFNFKNTYTIFSFGLFLINIGSVSNIIDRFVYRGVVDWIYIHYQEYSFAVFNFADIYISLGIILILYSYITNKKHA
ncbi:signal peptidase II [Candidatus Dependentiae bacterium]|nr:MAG: signal peptidase II [Candidatus Dependentiae bacterium]